MIYKNGGYNRLLLGDIAERDISIIEIAKHSIFKMIQSKRYDWSHQN
jgi:hypothetical protein